MHQPGVVRELVAHGVGGVEHAAHRRRPACPGAARRRGPSAARRPGRRGARRRRRRRSRGTSSVTWVSAAQQHVQAGGAGRVGAVLEVVAPVERRPAAGGRRPRPARRSGPARRGSRRPGTTSTPAGLDRGDGRARPAARTRSSVSGSDASTQVSLLTRAVLVRHELAAARRRHAGEPAGHARCSESSRATANARSTERRASRPSSAERRDRWRAPARSWPTHGVRAGLDPARAARRARPRSSVPPEDGRRRRARGATGLITSSSRWVEHVLRATSGRRTTTCGTDGSAQLLAEQLPRPAPGRNGSRPGFSSTPLPSVLTTDTVPRRGRLDAGRARRAASPGAARAGRSSRRRPGAG